MSSPEDLPESPLPNRSRRHEESLELARLEYETLAMPEQFIQLLGFILDGQNSRLLDTHQTSSAVPLFVYDDGLLCILAVVLLDDDLESVHLLETLVTHDLLPVFPVSHLVDTLDRGLLYLGHLVLLLVEHQSAVEFTLLLDLVLTQHTRHFELLHQELLYFAVVL